MQSGSFVRALRNTPGRFSEWWSYKTPLLAVLIYGNMAITGQLFPGKYVALFLLSYIGLSCSGYFLNDLFDIRSDQLGGKTNSAGNMKPLLRYLFLAMALAVACLPWLWLPYNPLTYILLAVEGALLLLYAAPPVRLKDRGLLAVVADSSYAYLIPTLITLNTFGRISGHAIPAMGVYLLVFTAGLRNILMHQYVDYDADKLAANPTLATKYGKLRVKRVVERLIFPMETAIGTALAIWQGGIFYVLPVLFVLYGLFVYYRETYVYIFTGRQLPANYSFVSDQLLNGFYTQWLPLLLLTALVFNNVALYWLPLVHYALFYPLLVVVLRDARFCYSRVKSVLVRNYYYYLTLAYQRFYLPLKTFFKHGT